MNWLSSHDDHLIFRKDAFQLHFYFCQRVLLLTRFEKKINSHVIQIQKILLFPFYRDLSKFVTYINIFLNPPPSFSNLRTRTGTISHVRTLEEEFLVHLPLGTNKGRAVGNRDPFVIIAVDRPNLWRISRDYSLAYHFGWTNERLGPRWRAICPLHERAGTRRETTHFAAEFGETSPYARHGIQSVQGTWWFGRVGGQMQMS